MFTWNSHYENFEIFVEYEKHYYILIFSHTQLKKVEFLDVNMRNIIQNYWIIIIWNMMKCLSLQGDFYYGSKRIQI